MKLRARFLLILIPLGLLLAAGVALWLVGSGRLQEYARVFLIERIEKSSGMLCSMERFHVDAARGSFDVGGFSLQPRPGLGRSLVLRIDEISGSLSLSSLWHPRIQLEVLNVLRPRIEVSSGSDGAPWNPDNFLRTLRISMGFEAKRIVLRDGELAVNNRRTPFDLSASNLACEMRYLKGVSSYRIHLAYKEGRIILTHQHLVHDLDTEVELGLEGLEISHLEVARSRSTLKGTGSLKNWNSPQVLMHVEGSVDAAELVLLSRHFEEAGGSFNVIADCSWDAGGYHVGGNFRSASSGFRGVAVSSLQGSFGLQKDMLSLKNVVGRIGEGGFRADGAFLIGEAVKSPNHFSITATQIPLREIGLILRTPKLDFRNTVNASTEIRWRRGMEDFQMRSTAELQAAPSGGTGRALTLQGIAEFGCSGEVWDVTSADLHSPYTRIEAHRQDDSRLRVRGSTRRLSEPLGFFRFFSSPLDELIQKHPDILEASGTYTLDGELSAARLDSLAYRGHVRAEEGHWRRYRVDDLAAEAEWSADLLKLHNLILRAGKQSVRGDLTLDFSAPVDEVPGILFQGSAQHITLAGIRDLGLDTWPDAEGSISGRGRVSNRGGVWGGTGQFSVEDLRFKKEAFGSLGGSVTLNGRELRLLDCRLSRNEARLLLQGSIDLEKRRLQVTARLSGLTLEEISAFREIAPEGGGRVSGTAEISGTLDNPAVKGSFDLAALRYAALDLGKGKGTLQLANHMLEAKAGVQASLGSVSLLARISTEPGYQGAASLEFRDINVHDLIAGKVPPVLSELNTALQGRLEVAGKFADFATLSIAGDLDGARFKSYDYEIYNADKIRFTVSNKALYVEKVQIAGEGTTLALSGIIPLDSSARLDLNLNGALNLRLLQHAAGNVRVAGSAEMNVRATGDLSNPQVIGQATLKNARLDHADASVHLTSMQGRIIFSRNLARLENVQGGVSSGTFEIQGMLEHQNAQLRNMNLQITLRRARFSYPKDFRTVVDADLSLRGGPDTQILTGDVNVIQANYLHSFNLLEQIGGRGTAGRGPLLTDPALLGLRLNVDIHSDNGLYIENELVRLRGGMRLALRGTLAYPSLTGRVESGEGTIFFRGNRFEIMHANADFLDRNRIIPTLDVRAEADVRTYRLLLDVTGDLARPNFSVTSDPPLSTVDIVSLLTTGKSTDTTEDSARRQSEMAGLSAASILSESLTGVIGKRVQRIFGLESFRVDPFLAGAGNDPTARITISQRLSKDLTVTFSRNLSTNEEQIVVLEYDVNRDFSVVATRDENGKFGLDFRFRRRFR